MVPVSSGRQLLQEQLHGLGGVGRSCGTYTGELHELNGSGPCPRGSHVAIYPSVIKQLCHSSHVQAQNLHAGGSRQAAAFCIGSSDDDVGVGGGEEEDDDGGDSSDDDGLRIETKTTHSCSK